MLALKAEDLKIKTFILSPSSKDPAAQLESVHWIKGDPYDTKCLSSFLKQIDLLTFESEFIPAETIKKSLSSQISIAPSLQALKTLQDRYTQKKILQKYHLKTSPFFKITLNHSKKNLDKLHSLLKKEGHFVLKTRTGGYDGYGTFIIKNKKDIFQFRSRSSEFIGEQFIRFKRELALIACRNKKGSVCFFPLVESYQKDSRCLWVKGPVHHKRLDSLKKQINRMLNALNYEGVLAFELFDTGSELWINEVAPRVHNSGHYSLDGLTEDQFTMHLKAIFNKPLSPPKTLKKGFAMLNLLGGKQTKPFLIIGEKKIKLDQGFESFYKNFSLWWYGKNKNTPGRKMGHINSFENSPQKALSTLWKARKKFKI